MNSGICSKIDAEKELSASALAHLSVRSPSPSYG